MPDEVGGLGRFVGLQGIRAAPRSEDANDPLLEFLPGDRGTVAILNLKTEGENVAQ